MPVSLLRSIALAVLWGAGLQGQTQANQVTVRIPAGAQTASLVVKVTEPPAPGDRIILKVNSTRLKAILVTPDGVRIPDDSPQAGRFGQEPPFGVTDGGFSVIFFLEETWKTGRYTIIFTSPGLAAATEANAFYLNQK